MAKNSTPTVKAQSGKGGKANQASAPGPSAGSSKDNNASSTAGLEVFSKRDGFRRAGFTWYERPTYVLLADITEEQREQLEEDPRLKVHHVDLTDDMERAQ